MQRGNAPIGPDGKPMELHHLNQANEGPVVELTKTFHSENFGTLHINPPTMGSGISRDAFDTWKTAYWKHRAKEFAEGVTQ